MIEESPTTPAGCRTIRWLLRATVIAMCLGQAWWLAIVQETPLVGWLHSPRDVGGWNFSESFALQAQVVVASQLVVTAVVTCFRSVALLLLPVAAVKIALAVAMWQMADGFQIVSNWLPPAVTAWLPFSTQGARVAAPLALWLYGRPERTPRTYWEPVARGGACLAFAGHGLEALWHSPQFADLILFSARRFGIAVTEHAAQTLLTGIGVVDLLLATLLITKRWRSAAIYAALWGLVTAGSRMTAHGLAFGWYETLIRAAHFGLPAALAVYWWHRPVCPPVPAPTVSSLD